MTTPSAPTSDVLAAFGLDGADVRVVADTRRATTWWVAGDGGAVSLRRSAVGQGVAASIARHLEQLADAGVAVPAPRGTVSDALVHAHAGASWTASAWVDGDAVEAHDADAAREAGALLATAHAVVDVADWPLRPELPPLVDVAEAARVDGWSLRSGMVRLGQPLPRRTATLADLLRRAQLHLDRVRRDVEQHQVVVHGDVRPANVLRRPDGSIALLDWEMAHVDGRAADLAVATRGWPAGAEALVDGYCSVNELDEAELAALPLLAAARGLDHLATRVSTWAADPRATSLESLTDELDAELPDLAARLVDFPDERSGRPPRGRGRGS